MTDESTQCAVFVHDYNANVVIVELLELIAPHGINAMKTFSVNWTKYLTNMNSHLTNVCLVRDCSAAVTGCHNRMALWRK
jgi:hypothetical protein